MEGLALRRLSRTFGAEVAGLDISEHGMYGYPEQFIPDAELYGAALTPPIKLGRGPAPSPASGSAEAATA